MEAQLSPQCRDGPDQARSFQLAEHVADLLADLGYLVEHSATALIVLPLVVQQVLECDAPVRSDERVGDGVAPQQPDEVRPRDVRQGRRPAAS